MALKFFLFVWVVSKANREILTFGDIGIYKRKSHCSKNLIWMENVDINKILRSNKVSFGCNGYK